MRKLMGLVLAAFLLVDTAYGDDIVVKGAWVRAMPPAQTATAAYMTIINHSSGNIVLVSASSDAANKVEIHQMSDMNGMMSMSMAPDLSIAPGGKLVFKPNGFHFMLIGLFKTLQKGDTVHITLHFLNGQNVQVAAHVK